jgi:hypothetical protein
MIKRFERKEKNEKKNVLDAGLEPAAISVTHR